MSEPEPQTDYWTVRAAIVKAAQDQDDDTLEFLAIEYPDIMRQMEREILNKQTKFNAKKK